MSEVQPLKINSEDSKDAQSLVHFLVNSIIEGVMEGRFVPGQRLVAADLAEQFQVSRAPIREALQVLVGEGVVEFDRNRGARIKQLSVKELIDIFEFIEASLILGIRLATKRIHLDDNKAKLTASFENMRQTWETKHDTKFVNSIYEFHHTINEISGNHFVYFMYLRPHQRFINKQLANKLPGGHWDQYIANYTRVYDTIMSGDQHAAEAAFSNHMQWAISILKTYMPKPA